MATTLHTQTPGENYVEGGTETLVDLYCNDQNNDDKKTIAKIEQITVRVDSLEPFIFEEVTSRLPGNTYMVLTKITNPCTTEITYAMERVNDVLHAALCCETTVPPFPPEPEPDDSTPWVFGTSETDPYDDLAGGSDTIVYPINGTSEPNASTVDVDTTAIEEDLYMVLREDENQPDRAHYFNGPNVYGGIPDELWHESFVINGYKYTVSRVAMTFDQNYTTKFTK